MEAGSSPLRGGFLIQTKRGAILQPMENGASDGARTRDLRRDRPAL